MVAVTLALCGKIHAKGRPRSKPCNLFDFNGYQSYHTMRVDRDAIDSNRFEFSNRMEIESSTCMSFCK